MKSQTRTYKFFCFLTLFLIITSSFQINTMNKKHKNLNEQDDIYYPSFAPQQKIQKKNAAPFGNCEPNAPEFETQKKTKSKSKRKSKKTYSLSKSEISSMLKVYGFNKYSDESEIKKSLTSARDFKLNLKNIRNYLNGDLKLPKLTKLSKPSKNKIEKEPNEPKISKKSKDKKIVFAKFQQDLKAISFILANEFSTDLCAKRLRKNLLHALGFFVLANNEYKLIKSKKKNISYTLSISKKYKKNFIKKEKKNLEKYICFFVKYMLDVKNIRKAFIEMSKKDKSVITTRLVFPTTDAFNQMRLKIKQFQILIKELHKDMHHIKNAYRKKKLTKEIRDNLAIDYQKNKNKNEKTLRDIFFKHNFGKKPTKSEKEEVLLFYGLHTYDTNSAIQSWLRNPINFNSCIKKIKRIICKHKKISLTKLKKNSSYKTILLLKLLLNLSMFSDAKNVDQDHREAILYALGFMTKFLEKSKFFAQSHKKNNIDPLNHAINYLLNQNLHKINCYSNKNLTQITSSLVQDMYYLKLVFLGHNLTKTAKYYLIHNYNNLLWQYNALKKKKINEIKKKIDEKIFEPSSDDDE
ncbi:hypothetical protein ACFLYU_02320 [Candidatus Dependentiae bacterium]